MKNETDHSKFNIVQKEPDLVVPFIHLQGATIIEVGFINECREGGLTIDYLMENRFYRLVIGFNELGAWKQWHGRAWTS